MCFINWTKENLLPTFKNNIATNENEDNEEGLNEENSIKTRIYSDCFLTYQVNDFKEMGYILNRVNHSVWFRHGLFHKKSIKSL